MVDYTRPMTIQELFAQPAPRNDVEEHLAPAKKRDRDLLKFMGIIFGLLAIFMVIVVFATNHSPGPTELGTNFFIWLFLGLVIGVPSFLFVHQDFTTGRLLLREGAITPGRALRMTHGRRGTRLYVSFKRGDKEVERGFLVPLLMDNAQALVGQDVQIVIHPSNPRALGLILEGKGLVTTR